MDNRIGKEELRSAFDPNVQQDDISAKIVVALERISESFRVLLWEKAKRLGLSPIQIQILIFVAHHSRTEATVNLLSREFTVTKPTISDAVAALERKKLLRRSGSTVDRRSYVLTLTPQGTEIVREAENFAAPLGAILSDLNHSQMEGLWQSLSVIIFGLNKSGITSRQRMCFNCRFYADKGGSYCQLLERSLAIPDIRIDCPEFIDATMLPKQM